MKKTYLLIIFVLLISPMISCQLFGILPGNVAPTPISRPQDSPIQKPTPEARPEPISNPTPTLPVSPAQITDLTNTHWVGRLYDQENQLKFAVFEIIFLPDGELRYYTPNSWSENGTWEQNGDDILLTTGNGSCDYYGILSGDTIAGARNCKDTSTMGWWVEFTTEE